MDLNTLITNFNNLMEAEEQAPLGQGLDALRVRYAARENLQGRLDEMATQLDAMNRHMARLPQLPSLEIVEWANAVPCMPNLAFLVIDTTGLEPNADIIKIHIADVNGEVELDVVVNPQRQKGQTNHSYTGITQEELKLAWPLENVWENLAWRLQGRFVISYGLEFVRSRLVENAKHYGLPPICFLGEDLQAKAMEYNHTAYLLSLSNACHRIGHTLPDPSMAYDRMQGQLSLLRAMSVGLTSVTTKQQADYDSCSLGEIDEHPF